MSNIPVITLDGASGTGKGVVSQLVAKQLGWRLLDSGALYRVLALAAQKHGVALDNETALTVLAELVGQSAIRPRPGLVPPDVWSVRRSGLSQISVSS